MDVFSDHEELSQAAAERIAQAAERAVAERGRFLLCLCGGTSPPRTYQLLSERELPWEETHIFFGDERWVGESGNHFESVRPLFPRATFHPYPLEEAEDAEHTAELYAAHLRQFFDGEEPRFDLAVQGLGSDGHTASLFPGSPALAEAERWVVAHYVPAKERWRLTLTYPVLAAARELLFLVSGAEKQEALKAVLRGQDLPATPLVGLSHARVFADRAATA